MLRLMRRLRDDERGVAMAFVALSMVVLLGFAGLAIDGGRLLLERRQLVTVADAAALAGASRLPDEEEATELAVEYAATNGFTLSEDQVTVAQEDEGGDPGDWYIEIRVQRPLELTFMKVVGLDSLNVGATSRATYGYPLGVEGNTILPLFITATDLNEVPRGVETTVKVAAGSDDPESEHGNFRALNLDKDDEGNPVHGGGASDFEAYLGAAQSASVNIGDVLFTETGSMVGKTLSGIQSRLHKGFSEGFVPVIDTFGSLNGCTTVHVVGLVPFHITGYNDAHGNEKSEIYGSFEENVGAAGLGVDSMTQEEDHNFGIRVVKLIR